MDDFRKPFEYTEEKRGLILLFLFMLVTVDLIQAPLYIMHVHNDIRQIFVLNTVLMGLGVLYTIAILYTAISCFKMSRNVVTISKAYLIYRTVFTTCSILILFFYDLKDKTLIGKNRRFSSRAQFLFMDLIMPLVFEWALSIGWYLYFTKSKRCKELVKKQA